MQMVVVLGFVLIRSIDLMKFRSAAKDTIRLKYIAVVVIEEFAFVSELDYVQAMV